MFRIRKISNPLLAGNRQVIKRLKDIVRVQFPGIMAQQIEDITEKMIDPVSTKYQTSIIIADDSRGNIKGFGCLLFMSDLKFCYLDLLAVNPDKPSFGTGGSIYERII